MLTTERNQPILRIDRYSRGARRNQVWTITISGLISSAFAWAGWAERDPAFFAGAAAPLTLTLVGLLFWLRQVSYILAPQGNRLERRASWAGLPCSVRTVHAGQFDEIRLGWFGGGGETLPLYWARIIGREKWTLIESGREDEVREIAERAGRLLGLPVR